MQIFRAYFSLSFRAKISFGPPLQMVGTPFQKFVKGIPTVSKGSPNNISAPTDEEKYALNICMDTFSIFLMLFEIKEVFYGIDKLENHSLELQR